MRIFIDDINKPAVIRMFTIWKKNGHVIVSSPKKADVQLSSIRIKNKSGLPTVLRLDGVYYDKGVTNVSSNSGISNSHSVANAIIYQSCMSKLMCEKHLTKRETKIYNIIYNGIDRSKWYNPKKHEDINIVSCAKWRRWKRLPEIVGIFKEFLKHHPMSKLHIIGPMKDGANVIRHKNIIYYNPDKYIGFDEIKKIYRTMSMCLYLAKKDWCPSSVVETIASGIPVITTNACGGATEMCRLTDGCVVVSGEPESLECDYIYKNKYNIIPEEVQKNIVKAMLKIVDSKRSVILPEELMIETAARKYIEIMEKVI